MTIEVATYISDLAPANPGGTDPRSEGDNHIRLIKQVLLNTFPAGTKAMYSPNRGRLINTTPVTLTTADILETIYVDTTANITLNLPALTGADVGWYVDVIKTTSDLNGCYVWPPSGNIQTRAAAVTFCRVGGLMEPMRFHWTGTAWLGLRAAVIGEIMEWPSPVVPPGWLLLDGSTISAAAYSELVAIVGTTLQDHRGRVCAGVDGGTNRLTSAFLGSTAVVNNSGGGQSATLTLGQLPTGITSGGSSSGSGTATSPAAYAYIPFCSGGVQAGSAGGGPNNAFAYAPGLDWTYSSYLSVSVSGSASVTSNNTSGQAHGIVQPTVIANKIIRSS